MFSGQEETPTEYRKTGNLVGGGRTQTRHVQMPGLYPLNQSRSFIEVNADRAD